MLQVAAVRAGCEGSERIRNGQNKALGGKKEGKQRPLLQYEKITNNDKNIFAPQPYLDIFMQAREMHIYVTHNQARFSCCIRPPYTLKRLEEKR